MQENNQPRTLEEFLKDCFGAKELARAIDKAMLILVLLLRYEPEQLKTVVHCYESLYQLKKLILEQNQ